MIRLSKRVLSDGSWAGLSRVVSSLPPIFLRRLERFWSLPTPTEHLSRRDPTVNAVLRSSGTLAPFGRAIEQALTICYRSLPSSR